MSGISDLDAADIEIFATGETTRFLKRGTAFAWINLRSRLIVTTIRMEGIFTSSLRSIKIEPSNSANLI